MAGPWSNEHDHTGAGKGTFRVAAAGVYVKLQASNAAAVQCLSDLSAGQQSGGQDHTQEQVVCNGAIGHCHRQAQLSPLLLVPPETNPLPLLQMRSKL